jgi:dihydrolipoamide dehydrogenase
MIVLGGGPVGSELAQAWSTLGTTVTLVEGEERLLPARSPSPASRLPPRCATPTRRRAHRRARKRVSAGASAGVAVELDDGGGSRPRRSWSRSAACRARGRSASTRPESRPASGGFLATDGRLRVGGREWLYAVGDVNGRALFTHMGKYQAWVAAENVLGREVEAVAEDTALPRVTFTDPQVAAVGRTLAQAEETGIDARAVDVPTDGTAGASFQGKGTGGTSRLVVDEKTKTVVGATFTGFETADFLHAATVAVVGEVPLPRLRHAVAAYPTRSEVWLKLLEAAGL